jgi:hypothetical protein
MRISSSLGSVEERLFVLKLGPEDVGEVVLVLEVLFSERFFVVEVRR